MRISTVPADEMVARARDGESAAFAALVDLHHAELVRVAYVVCGDIEAARDAAQTAWIKAWQRLPALRDASKVRTWLVAIAANEARQSIRSQRRRQVRELAPRDIDPHAAGPSSDLVDLSVALRGLSAVDRELLAMRYLAGFDSEEIARATGRSASGVRARLSRLVARLREELNDG